MTTCYRIVISVTWNVRARNREMTSDHSWYKLETTLCQNHPSLSDAVFSIWQKKPNLLGFPSHLSDDQSIIWSNCQMINLICQSISSTSSSLPTIKTILEKTIGPTQLAIMSDYGTNLDSNWLWHSVPEAATSSDYKIKPRLLSWRTSVILSRNGPHAVVRNILIPPNSSS